MVDKIHNRGNHSAVLQLKVALKNKSACSSRRMMRRLLHLCCVFDGETFGTQRIVLQLSFPEYFSFLFFFSVWKPRRVFYPPALRPGDEGRGERDGSSDLGCCHSNVGKQIKYKLLIAAGSWRRGAVV
ncbi:hypothetical protein KUCAC02_026343 [Chaenocephalus aceratus]|uniref:Uncharacterized protein n=1 Tax=Chaenocephalus aceratus TaxID=36190 RepID=A0ACB9VWC5_CHAAC|nr:hypothetical protein KUCAC02_026343 [Chaenocephalus aceratus]